MRDGLSGIAAAVIRQAFEDARPGSPDERQEVATARAFLFSDSRGWVASRRFWFAMAGLHEPSREALRRAEDGRRAA